MKNIFLFSILMLAFVSIANAQTAKGGCTTVTVTNTPVYDPDLYSVLPGQWINCGNLGNPCCRLFLVKANPLKPRYFLEKKNHNNGSWTTVAGPQNNPVLTEPGVLNPHGTYRVRINIPVKNTTICEGGNGVECLNEYGEFIGYWGQWSPNIYTNEVIMGKTVPSDNSFVFLDINGDSDPDSFDFFDWVFMNAGASINYDQWFLAIFEEYDLQRYNTTGWQNGKVWNNGVVNLRNVWQEGHSNWDFETYNSYKIQFVVENKECKNTDNWNVKYKSFFVCPQGTGCRFDTGIPEETAIAPNPVTNALRLSHFTPEEDKDYQLIIRDITGKVVKDIPSWQNEDTDVSDLSQGMYILNLTSNGKPLFSSKFVVNR